MGHDLKNDTCHYSLIGCLDYMRAWELQRKLAERVLSADQDVLLLLEHPPTYTLGLTGKRDQHARFPRVPGSAGGGRNQR